MGGLPPRGDRGQAHTLEAVIGALLLLTSVLFALQSTAVTPLSASTSSQHIENQHREAAQGVLAAAAENGSLKRAVLYYNQSERRFHGADGENGQYTGGDPNVTFATMLDRTFADRNIVYHVNFHFQSSGDNGTLEETFVYSGEPSDNAVSASWTTVLLDSDTLYHENGTRNRSFRLGTDGPIEYRGSKRMPDISEGADGAVYNVVRVEVVAWRI
jgi:hypothetical protein